MIVFGVLHVRLGRLVAFDDLAILIMSYKFFQDGYHLDNMSDRPQCSSWSVCINFAMSLE